MQVVVHAPEDLTLRDFDEPGFDLVYEDPTVEYSAMEMFATSMALCTYSMLVSYGEQIDAPMDNIGVRVRWDYVEDPFRIGAIDLAIDWPNLPPSRLEAAERAAAHCTIHNTLHHPPKVETRLNR